MNNTLITIILLSVLNSILILILAYYPAVKIVQKRIKNKIKFNVEG
ncbi:MAG: hypothetical protein ACFFAO_19630 [Candidatus Hermodarchaeota archaeon]